MAFNKSKALENALKFLNQGKVPQAIAEYQLILRADPRDQATLMTVGDLFARQGDMPHAIEYFERLAQVYLGDGFNSKAIAIYKKIAKLAPNELAPLERLADLYVQQGVLSEARPLFLQIAEAHLKANHAQKAVEVLHRLLDVEPENQRVQMRLAELYGMMGQKKEAAQTYLNYAQRLFERGEFDEAEKLVERSLEMDPVNPAAVLLKAKALAQTEKLDAAIATLGSHPEAGNGGEVTHLLVEFELRANKPEQAAHRARRLMAASPSSYTLLYQVADALIENGHAEAALPLLTELRAPMIEHGAQENYLKSLSAACTALPGRCDVLEQLADFCRHSSQPFHLNSTLGQLSDAYAARGDFARAEQSLVELVERNKNDERLVERLNQLRARAGGSAIPAAPEPVEVAPPGPEERFEEPSAAPVAAAPEEFLDEETQQYIAQALTDVDLFSSYGLTQKATHLLENVLQKAPRHTPTLERLLDLYLGAGNDRRTAELASQLDQIHRERGDIANADRFAELTRRYSKVAGISAEDLPQVPPAPVQVAQPAAEVQSSVSVPAFEEPIAAPEPVAEASAFQIESAPAEVPVEVAAEPPAFETAPEPVQKAAPPAPARPAAVPIEFEVPLVSLEDEPVAHVPEPVLEEPAPVEVAAQSSEELDLSDEWESIASEPANTEVAEPLTMSANLDPVVEPEVSAIEELVAQTESVPAFEQEPEPVQKFDAFHINENMGPSELASEPAIETPAPALADHLQAAPQPTQSEFEISAESPAEAATEVPVEQSVEIPAQPAMEIPQTVSAEELAAIFDTPIPPAPSAEVSEEPVAAPSQAPEANEFELELTPEPANAKASGPATTEDFISELVAELEDLEPPVQAEAKVDAQPAVSAQQHAEPVHEKLTEVFASTPSAPIAAVNTPAPVAANGHANHANLNTEAALPSAESLNQLAEVFQEFRSELGEMSDEDEDLETHYNLGIAYREMGLLDEAIGEFQKVAKAVQKGKPFPYMMNCSTMLGLTFMDKGEPKVASLWYQRALETPGLEEESILALRYDLGMALEAAGESKAALDTFRNVYAMNIDYRDVADRIALIQKR
ncbi:MAG: tetratricopeptide repeat protein [Candidatus Acidiferrales bacterium]